MCFSSSLPRVFNRQNRTSEGMQELEIRIGKENGKEKGTEK